METGEMEKLREIAICLSEGRDPLTGIAFQEDTLLNSSFIKEYNKKIAEYLAGLLKKPKRKDISINMEFINTDTIDGFRGLEEDVSISALCHILNKKKNVEAPSIRASKVTDWLCKKGYLTEVKVLDSQSVRSPTELGVQLGIQNIKRETSEGTVYRVNTYSKNAQKFIVDHINEIYRYIYF